MMSMPETLVSVPSAHAVLMGLARLYLDVERGAEGGNKPKTVRVTRVF